MSGVVTSVVEGHMILGAVVNKIGVAVGPLEAELALRFAAVEVPESHVHRLVVLGNDGVISDSDISGVFNLNGRLGLQPTYFNG